MSLSGGDVQVGETDDGTSRWSYNGRMSFSVYAESDTEAINKADALRRAAWENGEVTNVLRIYLALARHRFAWRISASKKDRPLA